MASHTPPWQDQLARQARLRERKNELQGMGGNVVPMHTGEPASAEINDGGAAPSVPPSIHNGTFTPTTIAGAVAAMAQPKPSAPPPPAPAEPARAPGPGWSGLVLQEDCDDWAAFSQLMMNFGDGLALVHVTAFSPAAVAGLKSGDFVKSVDDIPLEKFNADPPLAGTAVIVEAYRKGLGDLRFELVLVEAPAIKPKSRAKPPRQPMAVAVPCGALVRIKERPRWQNYVSGHPALQPVDKVLAMRIVSRYAGRDGKAWPGHATLAKDLGLSVRTIQRAQERLHHAGLLAFTSGRRRGTTNRYELTWPSQVGSKISYLRSEGGTTPVA